MYFFFQTRCATQSSDFNQMELFDFSSYCKERPQSHYIKAKLRTIFINVTHNSMCVFSLLWHIKSHLWFFEFYGNQHFSAKVYKIFNFELWTDSPIRTENHILKQKLMVINVLLQMLQFTKSLILSFFCPWSIEKNTLKSSKIAEICYYCPDTVTKFT